MDKNEKIIKSKNFKKYQTYNDINKNNKDVVEVSIEELANLPPQEKKKYKYLMTKNKSKVKGLKEPTDHELLIKILSKIENLEQFKTNQEKFNQYVIKQFEEQKEFNKSILSRLDNLIKLNNLKE